MIVSVPAALTGVDKSAWLSGRLVRTAPSPPVAVTASPARGAASIFVADRKLLVSPPAPSWMLPPGALASIWRIFARPKLSFTIEAVTPAPLALIRSMTSFSVSTLVSIAIATPLILNDPLAIAVPKLASSMISSASMAWPTGAVEVVFVEVASRSTPISSCRGSPPGADRNSGAVGRSAKWNDVER
ncbi:MAG: hypothetical protein R3A46_18420 [Thermomicrobiales bacterium]